jgi:H+/Cl- antiporter ClcA
MSGYIINIIIVLLYLNSHWRKHMKKQTSNYKTLVDWKDFRLKLFFQSIAVGLVSGMLVISYRYLLERSDALRIEVYSHLKSASPLLTASWFLFLVLLSYVLGVIMHREPMVSGSGIPQVKGVLLDRLKMNWVKVIVWKFIGGVLAIGAGLSLGREGPSVQLGAVSGQGLSRLTHRLKIEEKYLITSGASAGLAAAFNAPLAGVIFALEEIHKNFSPQVLTAVMAASVTADFVSKNFLGFKPVFNFESLNVLPLSHYVYLIILGIIVGSFGVAFNTCLVRTMDFYSSQKWLPFKLRPLFALIFAGILGFLLPDVLGGGGRLIGMISQQRTALTMLLVLIIVKFMFTMVSYGSGVPGGIFLPLLAIGALTGNVTGNIISNLFNMDPQYINNFIVLGMAGYFTAIVKAPITGTILITEMTGSFSHLLAIITVSMTAYLTTDILKSKPIYDELLERMLQKKNPDARKESEKDNTILEIAVSMGSYIDGKRVMDLTWPAKSLLVSVKRGEKEIIPKGNTRIYHGDYLIVLTNEQEAASAEKILSGMAEEGPVKNFLFEQK